jgi:hypothetical protein
MESDSKGIEVIKVKISKNEDKLKLFKDAIVSIPVSIVAVVVINNLTIWILLNQEKINMKNKITITGKISAILEKEYQGAKTTQVQFLMESDSKGIEVIKVKITKDEDKLKLFKDAIVSIPVSIVAVNGNLYYTQSDFLTVSNNTNKDTQK